MSNPLLLTSGAFGMAGSPGGLGYDSVAKSEGKIARPGGAAKIGFCAKECHRAKTAVLHVARCCPCFLDGSLYMFQLGSLTALFVPPVLDRASAKLRERKQAPNNGALIALRIFVHRAFLVCCVSSAQF